MPCTTCRNRAPSLTPKPANVAEHFSEIEGVDLGDGLVRAGLLLNLERQVGVRLLDARFNLQVATNGEGSVNFRRGGEGSSLNVMVHRKVFTEDPRPLFAHEASLVHGIHVVLGVSTVALCHFPRGLFPDATRRPQNPHSGML